MTVITIKDTDPVNEHIKHIQIWRRDAKKYHQTALYDLLSESLDIIKGLVREGKTYQAKGFTLSPADAAFSLAVKARAGWCCEKCGKQYAKGDKGLQCSHHYSRRHHTIRHHPDNAAALCHHCHNYWFQKDIAESGQWLKEHLGEEKLKHLAQLKSQKKPALSASEDEAVAAWFCEQAEKIEAGGQHELQPYAL